MARSVTLYAPPVSNLIHSLKYRTDRTVLSALSHLVARFDFTAFAACDLITPVPLFPKRLRKRGLNQALLLARLFFPENRDAIYTEVLVRVRDTVPQTRLDAASRRKNLRAAFEVPEGNDLAGKRVCVVDDVFTTGTTLRECARTLLGAGAEEVRAVTMARVVNDDAACRLSGHSGRAGW